MFSNKIFLCLILFLKYNFLTIHKIGGVALKDCQIKIHDRDWINIKDCNQINFDGWDGDGYIEEININYNLGDKI